jgi:nicotinate-nucleotide adenylyltransferase
VRLGVYGGSFDPPHLGHMVAASDACEALGLDRVLWIPTAEHPLKPALAAPAALRLEMVRAAIAGDARFEASDLELARAGPSYTVDTLGTLSERHPGAALFLLAGADLLDELPRWRDVAGVLRLATLAVLTRAGEALAAEAYPGAVGVEVTRVDVSATEVRRRAAAGRSIRYLVPEGVRRVVERERLYRDRSR